LPIDPVALEATLKTLRLTQVAVPTLWDEDTADELLHLVGTTYYNFVTAVLEDPLPSGQPGERVPLALLAALHGRAVAGLLTALALADNDEAELSAPRAAELIAAAIDTITQLSSDEDDRPEHETAVDYVRGVATTLSFVNRILLPARGLSLDPNDPRGPVESADDTSTSDDAIGMLLWCAAAAQCISATLQPDFRFQSRPDE
jgi:hypothetical protein